MKKLRLFIILLLLFVVILLGGLYIKDRIDYSNDLRRYPLHYTNEIKKYAEEYRLDPYTVLSVMRIESFFDPNAVSNMGAIGLMQIMPETGKWIAHKLKMDDSFSDKTLYDPANNIRFACWYLSFLTNRFGGKESAVICAYNAGHGTVERWLNNPDYVQNGELAVVPNADVRRYIEKYRTAYKKYTELYPDLFREK